MPAEAERLAEARPWFLKAQQDLRAAEILLGADPPLLSEAAYHCQQAGEKALKGFLAWHDDSFGKTHDLGMIGLACVASDPSLESLCRRAASLSVYAWAFRYPGDAEEPTHGSVQESLELAHEVLGAVLFRVPHPPLP